MFLPTPILISRLQRPDGSLIVEPELRLVASGTLMSVNPDRILLKRYVLSGHPFKVHGRCAVVRYMFFRPEDIRWFRSVELRTKNGLHGCIKEPVGLHGMMKCRFNGPVKGNDTVLLAIYKRVFPKWGIRTLLGDASLEEGEEENAQTPKEKKSEAAEEREGDGGERSLGRAD